MNRNKNNSVRGTPDSPMYDLIFLLVRLWMGRRKPEIEDARMDGLQAPYLLLANHESFYDFYYLSKLRHPKRPSYLVNEYYCTRPVLKRMAGPGGILSKKLFTKDLNTAVGLLRMTRRGYPVILFPEGRLSPDGRSNPIVEPGGALYQKLALPLVLVKIEGAYFSAPKWRKHSYLSRVRVRVERVLSPEALKAMTAGELDRLIAGTLYTDASAHPIDRYPQRDKAEGLENLLYRCADCGALYQTGSRGNEFFCRACGRRHRLDESYRFTDDAGSIPAYYDRIKEWERRELSGLSLSCRVRAKIHGAKGGPVRWEEGECTLTGAGFAYRSPSVSFAYDLAALPALAYSCGQEFELYYKDELYYFYPIEQPIQAARWGLLVDLLHENKEAAP